MVFDKEFQMKRILVVWFFSLFLSIPVVWSQSEPKLHWVAMRDGVELATDVFFPESEGPWPVVLSRTPYNRKNTGGVEGYLNEGIAFVIQDVRGRFDSKGHARPFADDGSGKNQDGYDAIKWVRAQKWSNGKIATIGGSALGVTQVGLAASGPQGIVGQAIVVAPISNYHHGFYQGGVFRKSLTEGWLKAAQWPFAENLKEMRAHPYYDEFWMAQNLAENVEKVYWPTVVVSGWYDIFLQGSIDLHQEIREHGGINARENAHLIVGPYTHGINQLRVGEFEFPEGAKIPRDLWPHNSEWVKYWLNGKPLRSQPPQVLYYTMGELPAGDAPGNEWRTSKEWPPKSDSQRWFLTPERSLEQEAPGNADLSFAHDPQNPVMTVGGQNLLLPAGAFDQKNVESRDDVLVFSSQSFEAPVEITGRIQADFLVSTSAEDAHFAVKFTDVYPDGRSMLIADGIRKLSLRDNFSGPSVVSPGIRYRVQVDLGSTSIVINKGHRLRVAVSGSNAPRFETYPERAVQTIYLGGQTGSYLTLPIPLSSDNSR